MGNVGRLVGNDQADQVLRVRQGLAWESLDRNLPVKPRHANVSAGLGHVGCVSGQAVNQKALAFPQFRRQLPVPTANMNDQAALDPRGCEDVFGIVCGLDGDC